MFFKENDLFFLNVPSISEIFTMVYHATCTEEPIISWASCMEKLREGMTLLLLKIEI